MSGAMGPRARAAAIRSIGQARDALDLWLDAIASYDGDEPISPDTLEASTAALFDRVPAASLVAVLASRESKDVRGGPRHGE